MTIHVRAHKSDYLAARHQHQYLFIIFIDELAGGRLVCITTSGRKRLAQSSHGTTPDTVGTVIYCIICHLASVDKIHEVREERFSRCGAGGGTQSASQPEL